VDAQPPRRRQEGARARDGLRCVLGWLDEDCQLRVGALPIFLGCPYRPLAFPSDPNGGGSYTHPYLVTLNHLVTRAFGLRYFTPNYRGHPHSKRRRAMTPPRHAPSKRSCCSRLCVPVSVSVSVSHRHPSTTAFIPRYFMSRLPCLQPAPSSVSSTTICYSYASSFPPSASLSSASLFASITTIFALGYSTILHRVQ